MSNGKDVAPAMGTDRVLKRPSSSSSSSSHGHGHALGHSARQDHHHNYTLHHNTTNHTHAHSHTHSHQQQQQQQQQQQRQQPKDSPMNNSSGQSSSSSRSLHSSLSLSRQTWTHSAFSLLTNESESNGSKGQHHSQLGLQQQQQHQTHASRLSLAGVCTVRIGPHLFLDTKFYTVVSSPSTTPIDSNSPAARSTSPSLALKQEPIAARSQSRSHSPQNQVAMEFKENPGKIWLFPPEASVEFSPANDRDSAQISASFQLPIPALSERSERPNRSSLSNQAISMTIMQATSALWEGLELAVSGPHTVITRSPTTKPKSGSGRPHIPSTHSEDTSEVLGSGKTAKQSSPFNGTTTKRQQDKAADHSSKPAKIKQQKDQEDKGRGATTKGPSGTSAAKKAIASGPVSNSAQKRCGYCNCTTTPMWRRGPNGPSTLCNACGVKWKHGKIMQDVTESQPAPTSGQGSSTTSSAPRSSNSSKSSKESEENGYSRQAESKKSVHKANHSGGNSSSSKANHDAARGESSSPPDKPKVKDVRTGGRRGSDADKIVPVKKRHLGTVSIHDRQFYFSL
ncbi:hypothetical protein BGZ90_000536 [Linnemannia elongata]|nr:hypothetical protein BGZ90_000536 [Linnemannia elongata]